LSNIGLAVVQFFCICGLFLSSIFFSFVQTIRHNNRILVPVAVDITIDIHFDIHADWLPPLSTVQHLLTFHMYKFSLQIEHLASFFFFFYYHHDPRPTTQPTEKRKDERFFVMFGSLW